jgi:hypothetical protein
LTLGLSRPLYDSAVVTHVDLRRIASSLPGLAEDDDSLTFRMNGRLVAWLWPERVEPRKRRVPNPGVLVVRVRDEMDKQTLLDLEPNSIFTERHYDGYAAVLVRLPRIELELLTRLITEAWELQSTKPQARPGKR